MNKLNKTFKINPLYEADGYKAGHKAMLAPNTVREAWTWIPRSLKHMHPSIDKIMAAGSQLTMRYIHSTFQENFFDMPIDVAEQFGRDMSMYFGMEYDAEHFSDLHKLGYLPIIVQALPEGTFTKPGIPHMAGINTLDGYAWLGLYLETMISKLSWQMPTAGTIGAKFKENAVKAVAGTDKENIAATDFMCHDFHSRGGNPYTSIAVALGHGLCNSGTDTLNAIPASRYYYDVADGAMPFGSVLASEHSVTCTGIFYYKRKLEAGLLDKEIALYYAHSAVCEGNIDSPDYLAIAEYLNLRDWLLRFPDGILSYVADTFDLWKLITYVLPRLKNEIMVRNGKLVIRPDSGNPVDIMCGSDQSVYNVTVEGCNGTTSLKDFVFKMEEGDIFTFEGGYYIVEGLDEFSAEYGRECCYEVWMCNAEEKLESLLTNSVIRTYKHLPCPEGLGVVELLWNTFGGDESAQGYKRLDPHIGAIYGDAITLERQVSIYKRLKDKGFAATNVVLGVGSYTYVMQTRDSVGYAVKGSWFEVFEDGVRECFDIYKDPITSTGTAKKSLKGFQYVYKDENGEIMCNSGVSESDAFGNSNMLKIIYYCGTFLNQVDYETIRNRLK